MDNWGYNPTWVVKLHIFCYVHPENWAKSDPIWLIFFQMGWFNYQLLYDYIPRFQMTLVLIEKGPVLGKLERPNRRFHMIPAKILEQFRFRSYSNLLCDLPR